MKYENAVACLLLFLLFSPSQESSWRDCGKGCERCDERGLCEKCTEGHFLSGEKVCVECGAGCRECEGVGTCEWCQEGYRVEVGRCVVDQGARVVFHVVLGIGAVGFVWACLGIICWARKDKERGIEEGEDESWEKGGGGGRRARVQGDEEGSDVSSVMDQIDNEGVKEFMNPNNVLREGEGYQFEDYKDKSRKSDLSGSSKTNSNASLKNRDTVI